MPKEKLLLVGAGGFGRVVSETAIVRTYAKVCARERIGSNVTVSNSVTVPEDSDIPNGSALL